MTIKYAIAALAALSAVSVTDALAEECSSGFLADLACDLGIIDEDTANELDYWHGEAGRPIETVIVPGIADTVLPGSGDVLRTWDHINRDELPFPFLMGIE